MPAPKPACGCTKLCGNCTSSPINLDDPFNIGILMSGPPKSKEEKKLEKLRREAERKR